MLIRKKLFSKQHHNIYIYIYIPRVRLLTFTHKISMLIAFKCKNKPLHGANDKILLFLIAFNCKDETFEGNMQQNLLFYFILFYFFLVAFLHIEAKHMLFFFFLQFFVYGVGDTFLFWHDGI